ncbi:hypothetical protein CONLIGDRAFT_682874 [Coniochaeta ligniaria NRRL 30616]|uniref:Uncharacterized protein n=1 Tax=Coniochaeta ligniaria NRRL 30616 TaxID=1408157 RepID=A0A1J7IKD1_9PEZI|nr:hypothetical protein CONLIGDRAFT_682874 [Coniochaeta ligniaria NRRL 30616]
MLYPRGEATLSDEQWRTLEIVTRTASALSALGVVVIIATFCCSRHFRNPMHRLIFINAFFNAFDVVCTMISISGPKAGNLSALCQFQAFLNQMFPVADVLWTLAMAVNVFLIVFRGYSTESLRRLEWKYLAFITTVTFIPAFTFLFIRTDGKGPMYGSVTLWCAIAPKWVLFRIVCYYVPIWSTILITLVLYCLVGLEIVKRRRALKCFTNDSVALDDTVLLTSTTAMTVKSHTIDSETGDMPTSHSTDKSFHTASKSSASVPRHLPSSRRPYLSFRQYVLMPLLFFLGLLSVWAAPTTNRFASFINPSFSSFPLLLAVGATGSLRGFWNGLVFITMGMKSWKRQKHLEQVALHSM